MGAVLVGLFVELSPFAKFSGVHFMQENPSYQNLLLCSPLHETWMYALQMTHHMPPFRRWRL